MSGTQNGGGENLNHPEDKNVNSDVIMIDQDSNSGTGQGGDPHPEPSSKSTESAVVTGSVASAGLLYDFPSNVFSDSEGEYQANTYYAKGGENPRKRKRDIDGSPEIEVIEGNKDILNMVVNVRNAILALSKTAAQERNTKKVIKERIILLQELNKNSLEKVCRYLGLVGKASKKLEFEDEKGKKPIEKKVLICSRCNVEMDRQEEEIKEVKAELQLASEMEQGKYSEFIKKKWNEKVFEKTAVVQGNPLTTKEGDIILFCKDRKEESALLNLARTRYPEIEDILEGGDEGEDQIQYIESVVTSKRGVRKRRVHVGEIGEVWDLREMLNNFKKEKLSKECKNMVVAVSNKECRDIVRKNIEVIFKEDHLSIELFTPEEKDKKRVRDFSTDRRERTTEAVVIKTNISTYAETLRNIRAVVDPAEIGVDIKAVKKTKDNNIVVVTNSGKAEALHREIAAKITGVETHVTGNNKTLLIFDVDATIRGSEVEEIIKRETREDGTQVRFIRTTQSGSQVATVVMPARAADALLAKGEIKIGWTRCRVKIKIDIVRCYNCLGVGHHSDICPEPRREKRCLKCAQEGHMSRNCENVSYCTSCERSGHHTESTACPVIRKLVQNSQQEFTAGRTDKGMLDTGNSENIAEEREKEKEEEKMEIEEEKGADQTKT